MSDENTAEVVTSVGSAFGQRVAFKNSLEFEKNTGYPSITTKMLHIFCPTVY